MATIIIPAMYPNDISRYGNCCKYIVKQLHEIQLIKENMGDKEHVEEMS